MNFAPIPATTPGSAPTTLLDACVVINLAASRRPTDILDAVSGPVAVADLVAAESLYVQRGGPGDDAKEPEPIDLAPLIASGRLSVLTATDAELDTFVDFLADLDEGEAMTLALAVHRGFVVATDDRRVTRSLAGRAPLRSTLDLVKDWADREAAPPHLLRTVLTDIRERGTYHPGRTHPLRGWWDASLATSQGSREGER